jgi:hypothetical protein
LAKPLTNLTRSKVKWEWTSHCQQSFLALKYCLTNAPLLRSSNEKLSYEVADASTVGLGAVLLQKGQLICFESQKLNDAEKNYLTTESEMLAVMHALKTWQCYLEGATFTVVTDHVSNTFFQTQPSLSRRQARWSEFLQRFGPINWVFRAERDNVADPLSRYPLNTLTALLSTPRISHGKDDDVHLAELSSDSSPMLAIAVTRRQTLPSRNQSGQTASAKSNTLDTSDLAFDVLDLLGKGNPLGKSVFASKNTAKCRLCGNSSAECQCTGFCSERL